MLRLLLADDHLIFRQGVRRMLDDHPDIEVVAEASSYSEVLEAVRSKEIDVAVLDLSMPGRDGVEMISRVRALKPGLKVLVMTMHVDESYVLRTIRAGCDAYLTKDHSAEDLVAVVRQVARGGIYVCPSIAQRMGPQSYPKDAGDAPHTRLSDREYKVFQMLVAGRRGTEIASELSLSEKTVSTHKTHVLKKLNLENASELMLYAIKHQLVAQ